MGSRGLHARTLIGADGPEGNIGVTGLQMRIFVTIESGEI
jgi:hypothetical protein